jgi:hypothetical protein
MEVCNQASGLGTDNAASGLGTDNVASGLGTWDRRARGCAPQAAPRNSRAFEGLCTRPTRPREASSAGPPGAYIFLGARWFPVVF